MGVTSLAWTIDVGTVLAVLAVLVTAANSWFNIVISNKILVLRLDLARNYVDKADMKESLDRLERLVSKLESRFDGLDAREREF